MTENRNHQRVILPRPYRVLQKLLRLKYLVRAVLLGVSSLGNPFFSLLIPFDFHCKCLFYYRLTLGFCQLPSFSPLFGCWFLSFPDINVCFCFIFTLVDVTVVTVVNGFSS